MKTDPALSAAAAAHHQLMTSHHHHKLNDVSAVAKSNDKSVKAEPLEQMSIYSSHFAAAAAAKPPHPLTGMPQHDSAGMLTGKNSYINTQWARKYEKVHAKKTRENQIYRAHV